MADSPDPRYFKDGYGLDPTWRFFFRRPRRYLWLKAPMWFIDWSNRRRDRTLRASHMEERG